MDLEFWFCPIHGVLPNAARFGMMFWVEFQLWYFRIRTAIGGYL